MVTPSEIRLYLHAQDHRLAQDIPGYLKLFCDIPGYTGIRYDIPLYLRWTVDELKDMIEHAHIELIKSVAHLTNNKDVFLCILRFHTRGGFLRHYERLLSELEGVPDAPGDKYAADSQVLCDL